VYSKNYYRGIFPLPLITILFLPSTAAITPGNPIAIRSGYLTADAYFCVSSTVKAHALTALISLSGLFFLVLAFTIISFSE
jgi:hypothetical protein